MNYKRRLKNAMNRLAKDSRIVFLGQTTKYEGSSMYQTLEDIPESKKIELPIMEDTQMGMSIGLSLQGYIPVSIFPRMDFLICAINQLVNHLDKVDSMSVSEYRPKVIIRTRVGSKSPFYPDLQHCSDYTEGLEKMLKKVKVIKLTDPRKIRNVYSMALNRDNSTLIIEDFKK